MNKQYITAILAITRLAFSSGAIAKNMSKSEYKVADKNIAGEYKYVMDICMTVAKGKENF